MVVRLSAQPADSGLFEPGLALVLARHWLEALSVLAQWEQMKGARPSATDFQQPVPWTN